jgi:nitroreductase
MELMEAIRTTRSMRRLKTVPIPDDAIRTILEAAIRAPSGGNAQGWSFIVVRDPALRARIGALYLEGAKELFSTGYGLNPNGTPEEQARGERLVRSAMHLAEHFHEAPVLIVACLRLGQPVDQIAPGNAVTRGSSIYPAVQNLMLAARELGIGSTLTTIHRYRNAQVREALRLPPDVEAMAIIPLGYPAGRWGEAPRRPLDDVVFAETYGNRLYAAAPEGA